MFLAVLWRFTVERGDYCARVLVERVERFDSREDAVRCLGEWSLSRERPELDREDPDVPLMSSGGSFALEVAASVSAAEVGRLVVGEMGRRFGLRFKLRHLPEWN